MIVVCPSCSARFQYDDARFQGVPRKRFRCPKCVFVFEVDNPSLAPKTVPESIPMEIPTAPIPSGPADIKQDLADSNTRETTARNDRDAMLMNAGITSGIPSGMRFSLAFLSGPQASTVRALTTAQTVIGREEGEIITNDPECSRRHCRIDIHSDATVWLVDLGSTNGTFVDGVQIFGTLQLTDRQEFVCGRSTFMLLARTVDAHGMG
ncbi:MAG: FHA domain-containing protein [Holophaga sp.]|nr:FHA domain-containing protein [Holophaga sp.]